MYIGAAHGEGWDIGRIIITGGVWRMDEKPIDTAIRYMEWHIANDFREDSGKGIPKGDWDNLKRIVELLHELRSVT